MNETSPVREAAREARSAPALRALARGGYVANGVVHALIGVIVIAVAVGARGQSDQAGAFRVIAAAPWGFVALWVAAALLAALGLWHIANGIAVGRSSEVKAWAMRASEWGQAIAFLIVAGVAVAVALGARPDPDESAQDASRGILSIPGGAFVLGAVGAGVAVAGIAFIVMGVRRSFRSKLEVPAGAAGRVLTIAGIIGFVGKGLALVAVGVLLIVAAVKVEPEAAGGLDGAVRALLDMTAGPLLVSTIGAGLIAYGLFCVLRARYARL